jgi:small-conductance mechanosensitive channel
LRGFLIDQVVLSALSSVIFTPLEIGTLSIALSDLLVFGLTVIASLWLSRFVRFALKEEVFSRVHLQRGIPNAITSTAGYVVLLGGFFIALSAAGIDLSRFTILAGAFGVGIGFGLQNVVNNFVSGLILIYERPVQAGDIVQIGDVMGAINRIGIRSSTIRTFEGAEVIVPNANLISEEVVNWTLSDKERRLKIPVGVAYGSDHVRVIEVILAALHEVPHVLPVPAPEVLFRGLGDSSLDFEVRIWTAEIFYLRVESDVLGRIYSALAQAGIEIPFPQRDLHLRSIDADAARSLSGTQAGPAVAKAEVPEL